MGRLGTVERHKTRQGKLVGEVYLTVDDPDKPGTSQLVKFAAFGDNAQALKDNYQPGQVVTAVGIPHKIQRRNRRLGRRLGTNLSIRATQRGLRDGAAPFGSYVFLFGLVVYVAARPG